MDIKEINDAKLQAAIARFESIHGAIEEVCPWFVEAIVEFAQNGLKDEDNFTDWQGIVETDDLAKAGILVNMMYEDGWPQKYQDEYDRLEDMLHPIMMGDEIDVLMVEVVRAIITQEKLYKMNRAQQRRNS